jgi:hypothetical protein
MGLPGKNFGGRMSDFKLSLEERETVLRINDLPGATWDAWTLSERWAAKFKRAGYEVRKDHQGGWSCSIPKDRVRVLRPEKRKVGFALRARKPSEPDEAHSSVAKTEQNPPGMVG